MAIPAGDYTAQYRTDSGPGLDHKAIELDPRNGHKNVQFHPGNSSENTKGCVLPGRKRGRNFVTESRTATQDINRLVEKVIQHDRKTGETTKIVVRFINGPSSERLLDQP